MSKSISVLTFISIKLVIIIIHQKSKKSQRKYKTIKSPRPGIEPGSSA